MMSNQIGISHAFDSHQAQIDIDVAYTAFLALFSTRNGVLNYLTNNPNGRGINEETLKFYRIGMKTEKFRELDGRYELNDCIVFPIFGKSGIRK